MMGVSGFKFKKDLRQAVGQVFHPVETSFFGPEYKGDGQYAVVGPDAHTKRDWYATVTVKDGLIVKVT